MNQAPRGHRSLPHTADLRIEAWGPTREECLGEAVAALAESVADIGAVEAPPARTLTSELTADTDEDALLAVLDEVIYLLDTAGEIPLRATVEHARGTVRLRMDMTATDQLEVTGAAPKAVSLHNLQFGFDGQQYSCVTIIDV